MECHGSDYNCIVLVESYVCRQCIWQKLGERTGKSQHFLLVLPFVNARYCVVAQWASPLSLSSEIQAANRIGSLLPPSRLANMGSDDVWKSRFDKMENPDTANSNQHLSNKGFSNQVQSTNQSIDYFHR